MARLIGKDAGFATVQLPSGEVRQINWKCRATIGQLGNLDWINIRWGKAGRTRHRGIRPTVRGVAQNPMSHPLGGGEGRSGGGRHPVSKWGVPAKGGKTRNPRKNSSQQDYSSPHDGAVWRVGVEAQISEARHQGTEALQALRE